jgi:hypothetical protein
MWFTFVTARLFISLSFQPRLTATLSRLCSAVNSPIRQLGLAPTFKPDSPAQALFPPFPPAQLHSTNRLPDFAFALLANFLYDFAIARVVRA